MAQIPLNDRMQPDTVQLPRTFITDYMMTADALCLKTYLYLLNALSVPGGASIGLKEMEQALGTSRTSLCYALHYWADNGLIELEQKGARLSSIALLPVRPRREKMLIFEDDEDGQMQMTLKDVETPQASAENSPADTAFAGPVTAPVTQETVSDVSAVLRPDSAAANFSGIVSDTRKPLRYGLEDASTSVVPKQQSDELLRLESDPRFKILMQTLQAPSLMDRELKRTQVDELLEIFRRFEQDEEAILAIADYCQKYKSKKTLKRNEPVLKFDTFKDTADEIYESLKAEIPEHKNEVRKLVSDFLVHTYAHRFETDPIYTEEDSLFTKIVFAKLGLDAVKPTIGEINSVHSWRETFGSASDEILLEACDRTRSKQLSTMTGGTSLAILHYYNTILGNWNKAGIRTLSEVRAADTARRAEAGPSASAARPGVTVMKDFNDFPQHDYDYNQHANEAIFNDLKEKVNA
ncbi:MAG: DnaD domain protein [Lachnospiraceae bacterium]|nr:DnaD domain protein [Lachnospiraceae bacterium]